MLGLDIHQTGFDGLRACIRTAAPAYRRPPTTALLVLTALVALGCRTPWSIDPLPFDSLETGMRPGAVRSVLGEPSHIEALEGFPPTRPGLATDADYHATQAWHYEDEKIDPLGLGFATLVLPVTLPIYLVQVALRADEGERDCIWIEEREIALYFEDERLVDWVVAAKPERDACTTSPGYSPPPPIFQPWNPNWPNRRHGC